MIDAAADLCHFCASGSVTGGAYNAGEDVECRRPLAAAVRRTANWPPLRGGFLHRKIIGMAEANPGAVAAEQIMSKKLVTARPEQSLAELELLLIEHRISGAPVVVDGRLVGVISLGDIPRVDVLTDSLDRMVEEELQIDSPVDGFQHPQQAAYHEFRQRVNNLTVRDAMSDQVVTCHAATPAAEVAAQMVRHHIHRVIVVDGETPIGVVSSLDLAKLVAAMAATVAASP